jgi:hypothetical protein
MGTFPYCTHQILPELKAITRKMRELRPRLMKTSAETRGA